MQMQELLAAHYRAEALERSRVLSEQERGRDRLHRFLFCPKKYCTYWGAQRRFRLHPPRKV